MSLEKLIAVFTDRVDIIVGVILAIVAYSALQAVIKVLSAYFQSKLSWKFLPVNGENKGNGNGKASKKEMTELIKAVKSVKTAVVNNGERSDKKMDAFMRSQDKISDVILATDEDLVHKVHNKPSIERAILKILSKVTGGGSDG